MEKLPKELNEMIMGYVYNCAKDRKYILNKEMKDVYEYLTKDCERIFILKKNLCKRCEEEKIIKLRMIMNNLLPG